MQKATYCMAANQKPLKRHSRSLKPNVNREANRFHRLPEVCPRIEELREAAKSAGEADFICSVNEKKRLLWQLANSWKDQKPSACISAIAELNRMDGDHAATKAEVVIDSDINPNPTLTQEQAVALLRSNDLAP